MMMNAIRGDNTGPTLSSRNLAILHTAIYDAVNSIDRSHQPYRFQLEAQADSSVEAAAAAAAYEVMKALYPPFKGQADILFSSQLKRLPSGDPTANGLELGSRIGLLSLESRSSDGASTKIPYIPSNEPGQWQRTPPFFRPPLTPQWRYVSPFCLDHLEPFVPPPPPSLASAEYAAAVNELKGIGGKQGSTRTPEQSLIATYWSDFSYTAMPPGHWHEIAATISSNRMTGLVDNARLFALLSVAQADAGIVCWEAKFRYNLWRPITAIRRADEDGNPDTLADSKWDHYLNSPPFPAYTSGHSTFSKASAEVLTTFYGTDALTFATASDTVPGVSRVFHSLAACAEEVGMSRIYGGIHFSFDNHEGKISGAKVAQFITDNFLLPESRLPLLTIDRHTTNTIPDLRLHGRKGSKLLLEASSSLEEWTPVSTNAARSGGVVVPMNFVGEARFYRVIEE